MKVHMLVGICASDWMEGRGSPIVAGCIDHVVWEHMTDEEVDEEWGRMKNVLDPGDGDYYEWREIVVTVNDEDVSAAFKTPEARAEVSRP